MIRAATYRSVAVRAGVLAKLLWLLCCHSALSAEVADYLSIPGPIQFGGTSYVFAWSSHPSADYYKQEYFPAGQTSDHFDRMVLVEAIAKGIDVDGALRARVAALNQRKATDPLVNFAIVANRQNGETIIDFVIGDETGKESIVEWNAYRYAPLKVSGGGKGVLLFGISRRAYGDASTEFLRQLKSARTADIDALARYPLPAVQLRR
jgi:hypothetical protein